MEDACVSDRHRESPEVVLPPSKRDEGFRIEFWDTVPKRPPYAARVLNAAGQLVASSVPSGGPGPWHARSATRVQAGEHFDAVASHFARNAPPYRSHFFRVVAQIGQQPVAFLFATMFCWPFASQLGRTPFRKKRR